MEDPRPPRPPLVPPGGSDCHVADMTATFSADLSLRDAQEVLGRHGQWLPVDGDPEASLGQLVERNSTGPLRLGYGAWRDLLLGCQFRNGRGDLITAGGRTVKNVAGYDLTKFMVGQGGVFGRVVTITTRTYRRPAAAAVVRLVADPAPVGQLIPTDLRPHWALLTRNALWCGYLGDERAMDFYQPRLQEMGEVARRSVEEDIAHRAELWRAEPAEDQLGFRASVPLARLHEMVEQLPATTWSADAAFGIVLGVIARDRTEQLKEAAGTAGGTVYLWDSDGKLLDVPMEPARRELLGRLRWAFGTTAVPGVP